MFRFYTMIVVSIFVVFQSAKSEAEFKIDRDSHGNYSVQSNHFAELVKINPDPYLDLVLVKEDTIKIFLNKGNGELSDEASLQFKLKAKPEHVSLTVNESGQAVIRIKYGEEQEQHNLSQICVWHTRQNGSSTYAPADSLDFQQVWSWEFPINNGYWTMTAGDLDNDGKVEIISSMTDTASIEHGWIIIYESVGDNTYQHDLTIEVNFHAWFHAMKITDWDQDGNKELTCAVDFRIKIWEFYGDKNFHFFNTTISMGEMKSATEIFEVDTDNDQILELITIFGKWEGPWRSRLVLYEFTGKSLTYSYFGFNLIAQKAYGASYYSIAVGDMDNDGWLDILPGYGQLWPPSPNVLNYIEYDPVNQQFLPKYFSHPYPIDPSFSVIADIDGDGLNEAFITGVGRGYAGMLFLKSDYHDHYQIINVDTVLFEGAGSHVKTTIIDGTQYICKATSHLDISLNAIFYYLNFVKWMPNNTFHSVFTSSFHEPESYIHFFEILDMDHDSRENIVYKKVSYYGTHLFDLEKTTVSSLYDKPVLLKDFLLLPNFPNPFNQSTIISFITNKVEQYNIVIFDVLGRKVWENDGYLSLPGKNQIRWNGKNKDGVDLVSGIYYFRISSKIHTQHAKMIMIR